MKLLYKIFIIALVIILILYLFLLYINRTFIPVKLKNFLINSITEQTRQKTEIDSLNFSITRGFVLNGVRIYAGPKENNELLFKAERIYFGIIFFPSLKKHHLIIPRLSLYEPYLNLERAPDGSWNISSLLAKKKEKKKASPFRFTINGVSFDKGKLLFADYYQERKIQKTITALRGRAGLSLPDSIALSCTAKIDDAPLRIVSRYKFPKKELSVELETKNLALADYCNVYLPALSAEAGPDASLPALPAGAGHDASLPALSAGAGHDASLPPSSAGAETDKLKVSSGSGDILLNINISNFEEIKAKGSLHIQNLKAVFKDVTASGNYKLSGNADFNIKNLATPGYDLKLELAEAKISSPLKLLKTIDKIEGELSLSEKRWDMKKLSCLLYGSPAFITGAVDSPHKDFNINVKLSSTLALENIADAAGIGIESGRAKVKASCAYKKDKSYHISTDTQIENLKLRQKEILIAGDFVISGEFSGVAGDLESLKYNGKMGFAKAKIEGAGLFPFISDASGEAAFGTGHITIKRLDGIAADTRIALSGSIDYTQKDPSLELKLKADEFSLSKLLSTLPEEAKTKFKEIDAKGVCSLILNFSGTVGKPETYNYEGNLLLREVALAFPYWPNQLTNLACDISFKKQEVVWKDLYFDIKDKRYHSYGRLVDLTAPKISLSLESKEIELISEIKIEDKIINILRCKGKFLGSAFLITGKISDLKTGFAFLSGNADIDLKDLPYIFKAHQAALAKFKPQGMVRLKFDMRGPLKETADCTLYVEGGADYIYLGGLRLDDFYFDYRMKDRFIDIPVIAAYPYGGIINISSRVNLKKTKDKPYIINIDAKDVDLDRLIKDTEFKNKKIKGSFAAQAVLNGFSDVKDSLKGSGWLQVSNGYLWEFPVMRGIMEVIFLMPPEYVALTDAFGNFSVQNRRICTEDFKVLSKTASLLWVGSLGLDGTLDFDISGRFAEDIIKKTTEPGRIASAILREAGSLIMEIKLTGTLAKPKYQIVPFPVQRIFKEKVVDKFKDIFGGIFD